MATPRASLHSLDDDVLRRILTMLPSKDRMKCVPLVCNRWHRVMADPSIWSVVDVELRGDCDPLNAGRKAKWLQLRGSGMRKLTLRTYSSDTYMVNHALLHVAPAATQLQQLRIRAWVIGVEALACVSQLCSLTRLEVSNIRTPLESSTLNDMFDSLPALQSVDLAFSTRDSACDSDFDSDDEANQERQQPNDFPESLLRCTRLTSLVLSMHQLESYSTMFTVGGLPEGIAALHRLQHLRLYNCMTAPLALGVSQLTQLTSLKIQSGDLYDHDADICVMTQLTLLESLSLDSMFSIEGEPACSLSVLQRLTCLHLNYALDEDLWAIAGCTGLRTLCLSLHDISDPQPLPCPHLTRLQLRRSEVEVRDIMTIVSELPQLRVLHVLDQTECMVKLQQFDTGMLSQLPKLREVNLSGSLPRELNEVRTIRTPLDAGVLPSHVTEELTVLQKATPHIDWVLSGSEGLWDPW